MAGNIYDWSLTPANNSNADGDINWTENQLPSTVNNSARQLMARIAEMLLDKAPVRVSTGAANVYAVTIQSVLTAYDNGLVVAFRAHQANTGAAQININGLGLKPLRTVTATALLSGAIALNQCLSAVYVSATDEFLIFSGALDATKVPLAGGTMTGALISSTNGFVTPAADTPLITKTYDVFTSGAFSGLGRWGLFMGLAKMGLGTQDGNSFDAFKLFRYALNSTVTQEATIWSSGNTASQAEAEAGTENTRGTTSLRVAQHVDFRIASQAEMEAASSLTKLVTPGRLIHDPGNAKVWINWDMSANTIRGSRNVNSVTSNATGKDTVNFSITFSSANFSAYVSAIENLQASLNTAIGFDPDRPFTTTSASVFGQTSNGGDTDFSVACLAVFGDL